MPWDSELWSTNLPYKEQEALEAVVGFAAVGMVTYMILWMRSRARGPTDGTSKRPPPRPWPPAARWPSSRWPCFAVLREGLETAVFLLAAFNASESALAAGVGATLGVLVAVVVGYGIYRGGVRLNLARFFRITGVVLVFVAAGLVASFAPFRV